MTLILTPINRSTANITSNAAYQTVTLPSVPTGPGFAYGRALNEDVNNARMFGYRMPGDTTDNKRNLRINAQVAAVFPFNASGQTSFYRETSGIVVKIDGYITGTDVVVLSAMNSLGTITAGANAVTFDLTSRLGADAGNVALVFMQSGGGSTNIAQHGIGHPGTAAPINKRSTQAPLPMFSFMNAQEEILVQPGDNFGPYLMGYIKKSDNIIRSEANLTPNIAVNQYSNLTENLPSGFTHGLYYVESTVVAPQWELRETGETVEDYRGLSREHTYAVVKGDTLGRVQFKTSATGTKVWRFGYMRASSEAPPDVPTLSTPANAATNVALNPTLAWNAVTGATSYQVQVSTIDTFTTTVFNTSGITGTSQQVSPNLNYGTQYYWRVRSFTATSSSNWSTFRSFSTLAAPTVSITSPANNATVSGVTTINATTTGTGIVSVRFEADFVTISTDTTSPYSASWDTTLIPDGTKALTAVVTDAYGSITSDAVLVNVANVVTASISSPVDGAIVQGTITVSASFAGPNITNAQFKLDGANLGTADTTSPYSATWNTTTATEGTHSLSVVVTHALGTTTSSSISVIVDNDNSVILSGPLDIDNGLVRDQHMYYDLSSTPTVTFYLEQSTTDQPATSVTPTVIIQKNGGLWLAPTNAVVNVGNGYYALTLTATETNLEGDLNFVVTATGAKRRTFQRHVRNLLTQADIAGEVANGWQASIGENEAGAPSGIGSRGYKLDAIYRDTVRNKKTFDSATGIETVWTDDNQVMFRRQWVVSGSLTTREEATS